MGDGSRRGLSEQIERELGRRVREQGDRAAWEMLVVQNEALVRKIASRYVGYLRGTLAFDDLVQEGQIGLMRAVWRYDERRGRLSAYAVWWIAQAVAREAHQRDYVIRIPMRAKEALARLPRLRDAFAVTHGREPTVEEMAGLLRVKVADLAAMLAATTRVHSLDAVAPWMEQSAWAETPSDPTAPDGDDVAERVSREALVAHLLAGLTPQERRVIELRHGLGNGVAHTLEEVARLYGVTRERIRRIEARALRTMRGNPRARAWREQDGEGRER